MRQRTLFPIIFAVATMVAAFSPRVVIAADEPVITVVADFEGDTTAASIGAVTNVLQADCKVRREPIPARGQYSLGVELGVTRPDASATIDLVLREPIRFFSLDRVGAFVWIKTHPVDLAFRFEDAAGNVFATPPQRVDTRDRWVATRWSFTASKLIAISDENAEPEFPLQMTGLQLATTQRGRQYVYIDDLQVEHKVPEEDMLLARFTFDEATRIYEPGKFVATKVTFENRSQSRSLQTSVELRWLKPDGTDLKSTRSAMNLPHSTADFRSYQSVDFSQRISDPGLYRLVATANVAGWRNPPQFETTIAVAKSNRFASRGRARFFGVRSNLFREPAADQQLEIALARDLGAQVVMLDAPWRSLEPKDNDWDVQTLEPLVDGLSKNAIETWLSISNPPEWVPADRTTREKELAALCGEIGRRFSGKVTAIQFAADVFPDVGDDQDATISATLRDLVNVAGRPTIKILPPTRDAATAIGNADSDSISVVEYTGHPKSAGAALTETEKQNDDRVFQLTLPAINRAGNRADAVSILRLFIRGAASGVQTLQLFDLRDDDVGNYRRDALRGITQRDFSPKMWLVGYLSAAGIIGDMTYSGEVFGAPPEYDSALFTAGARQTAILIPKPNRILPALIAPIRNIAGDWSFLRFDREKIDPLSNESDVALASRPEPIFATLQMSAPQAQPQIGFDDTPWVRVPGTIFTDQPFDVVLTPGEPVRNGYLQLIPDRQSKLRSVRSSFPLRADPKGNQQTITAEITSGNQPFDSHETTLRVKVNNKQLDIPLTVYPGVAMPFEKTLTNAATKRLGTLQADGRPTATVTIAGAYNGNELLLDVQIEDDKIVATPTDASTNDEQFDELRFGVALEGVDDHVEMLIKDDGNEAKLTPLLGSAESSSITREQTTKGVRYTIRLQPAALGVDSFTGDRRLRLAFQYRDFDYERFAPEMQTWGSGLDAGGSSEGYRWILLEKEK